MPPRMRDPSPRGRGDPLERRWKTASERTGEMTGHAGEYRKLEGTPYPEIRCLGDEDFCGFRSHLTICRQVMSSDVTPRSATHM